MVSFTSFSERSGEEAAYALMRSLSKLMDEAVREQGGIVQSFTGDGIMAVFGAPVAFEDAPVRACRAALAILQQLRTAGPDLELKHGVKPQLRIGLNTGAAVVGQVQERADVTVLGDTVNFASRLQALAEPDSIFLSEATHRLVQGMVEASFAGEHAIKGKAEPQKVYRLDAVRHGATRFEATVSRGLSTFVGREREMEVLERGLDNNKARSELCVIDIAAEPGMGKSRLVYEFRQRFGKEHAFILSGSCSPDGQQTPFLPFIEVVRGSFRVNVGEAEKDVEQKLEMGLTTLGLHSGGNLGLLLHLLGLKVPGDALTGLDGVLIGLRTRELLQQLLEARCRLSPVVMVIEDLHWIDSASQELLGKIVEHGAKLRLLLLTTHRPEYAPPWLNRTVITKLGLEPLPVGHIRRLIQARLGVDVLPEALARQVAEKAEGNPLFAEEIVSYLTERGIIHSTVEFDAKALAETLPLSVQSLLTGRVDQLEPNDRALLQAASVIGRRFNPELLAVAVGETDIDARLTAMRALDLVLPEGKSGDYVFKHVLVRDAVYQSLLSEARRELHLKIAEEIERRNGNRLNEVAEVLAHHYNQSNRSDKAFAFLSMAGGKSLSVYSLDEAAIHLNAALAVLEKNPDFASSDQIAEFFAAYSTVFVESAKIEAVIDVLKRYSVRIDRLGDDPRVVVIRHHYMRALMFNARYREGAALQDGTSRMADRLGDSRSKAYSLTGDIWVSTICSPKTLLEFEALKRKAIKAVSDTTDAYLQCVVRWNIGYEELHRGRMTEAREAARELMQVGRMLNDPRSTGMGLWLLSTIALAADSYAEALTYCEQSMEVAVTGVDRMTASEVKGCALVLLRRIKEGAALLEENRQRCITNGYLITLSGSDVVRGAGHEKPPILTLLKNLPILLKVTVTAPSRILALIAHVLENPHLDPAGHHVGRAQMILGLLYKANKKRALALEHLTEAKRIFSQFGQTQILARVETALAELGQ
jgi:class 3 adenylate cyclase